MEKKIIDINQLKRRLESVLTFSKALDIESIPFLVWSMDGTTLYHSSPSAQNLGDALSDPKTGIVQDLTLQNCLQILASGMQTSKGMRYERLPLDPGGLSALATCACYVVLLTADEAVLVTILKDNMPKDVIREIISPSKILPKDKIKNRKTVRFLWRTDKDGFFSSVSEGLSAQVGMLYTDFAGKTWDTIIPFLVEPIEGALRQALKRQKSWHSIPVLWPLEEKNAVQEALFVPVELSATRVLDLSGAFQGYSGFGLCRLQEIQPSGHTTSSAHQYQEEGGQEIYQAEYVHTLPPVEENQPHQELTTGEKLTLREIAKALMEQSGKTSLNESSLTLSERIVAGNLPEHQEGDSSLVTETETESATHLDNEVLEDLLMTPLDDVDYKTILSEDYSHDLTQSGEELQDLFSMLTKAYSGGIEEEGNDNTNTASFLEDNPSQSALDPEPLVPSINDPTVCMSEAVFEEQPRNHNHLQRIRELESVLDTATDGVVAIDEKGGIISLNRSAEALFGYEQQEVIGQSVTALLATESHIILLDYLEGLQGGGIYSLLNGREVLGRVKQGGTIPLFLTMGEINDAPQRKYCMVLRDITAFKKAETELLEAKRVAERASAQKSDFLAKISHDVRTPMNAIIGFTELMLEERFGAIGNPRYHEYLKDVHTSGNYVLSLINDLLDLAKIEAGKVDLFFSRTELNELAARCVALLQPEAAKARVLIRTNFSLKLPPIVADERSLQQIVMNLLSNAVKYTEAGGQVIVSTSLSDFGEAVLRVRDTGIGMREEDIRAALEPFRQLTTTPAREGSGLGLSVTKALVEANRGLLHISSSPGQGTLVEVLFPPTRVLVE